MSEPHEITDRRVLRTRSILLDALRTLLMERGYERLTIQAILDRAGVGRATFYTHFKSKDDLLEASLHGLRGWLLSRAQQHRGERLAVSLPLFEHLDSHRAIYRCTIGRRGEVTVPRLMRRMLRDLLHDDIARHAAPADASHVSLTTDFAVSALWSTVVWWMTTEPELPAADVNRRFRELVFNGIPDGTRR